MCVARSQGKIHSKVNTWCSLRNKEEGAILFSNAISRFYIRLYAVGHMVKDHSDGYRKPPATTTWATLLRLAARELFIHHPIDRRAHTTTFGTRNISMVPPWGINPTTHCTMSGHSTTELYLAPSLWVVGSILHGVDPLSYFSFQPVLHDWCNKGCGMCYPVCGMVHIKEPLLLIDKSSVCGGSGFPFSLSEWSLTIRLTPYNRK